jgi:hypothetical protein
MEDGFLGGHFLAYLVTFSKLSISFSVSDGTAIFYYSNDALQQHLLA